MPSPLACYELKTDKLFFSFFLFFSKKPKLFRKPKIQVSFLHFKGIKKSI